MFRGFVERLIGTWNQRELRRIAPLVAAINALEPRLTHASDSQLRAMSGELATRYSRGERLDQLLPDAFALVREAAVRTLHMRLFDVQLVGGIVLHHGQICEMQTGEGKTLVATLPAYLNALAGRGVHVATVNDYLAWRDCEWVGRIHRFLGLSVGVVQHPQNDNERRLAYAADITFATSNELAFDYLRDNMKFYLTDCVQRGHAFAIIDEIDSILIDEARTPLIISAPSAESAGEYVEVDSAVATLAPGLPIRGDAVVQTEFLEKSGDFLVDHAQKTVTLTESGIAACERLLASMLKPGGLQDPDNSDVLHRINQALRGRWLYRRDTDYIVKDGEIVLIDDLTGRLLPGRTWQNGLHQAVQAKEKIRIQPESDVLASITLQNYFRKYEKLSGMTGTASTVAEEFLQIYRLPVVVIPPNRPLRRREEPDMVYRTEREKLDAVCRDVLEKQTVGQPVLIGTVSVEKSEHLSTLLRQRGVKHVVLNAKYHAQEADIVALAGQAGKVTITTAMAGRGTDILLGGHPVVMARRRAIVEGLAERLVNDAGAPIDEDREFAYFQRYEGSYRVPLAVWRQLLGEAKVHTDAEHDEVVDLGGLHVIGTERHEARRIDLQLRGRAGRQGDPGSSRFYLSLEDDLMRNFGAHQLSGVMQRLGLEGGVPIEHTMVTRAIKRAQEQIERMHSGVRRLLLEYDDVLNEHRESVYKLRRGVLAGRVSVTPDGGLDTREYLMVLADEQLENAVQAFQERGGDFASAVWLKQEINRIFGVTPERFDPGSVDDKSPEEIVDIVFKELKASYDQKEALVGSDVLRRVERDIVCQNIDLHWKQHLLRMELLKEGIGLHAFGRRDRHVEYRREGLDLFDEMKARMEEEIVRYLFWLRPIVDRETLDKPQG